MAKAELVKEWSKRYKADDYLKKDCIVIRPKRRSKNLRRRIEKLEQDAWRIEEERYIADAAVGGYGGTQH